MENTINQSNRSQRIKKFSQGDKKPELKVKSLGEMIINYLDNSEEHNTDTRLFQPKRQLINYLFNGIGSISETQLETQLSFSPLDKEDNLILYTFFLSQIDQFNYEWSYLISKFKIINDFLKRFNKYINFVCTDINSLISSIHFSDNTLFQIDEFLQIFYYPTQNLLSAQLKLDLIGNLLLCKAGEYRLKVICESKTIIALERSSKENSKSVIDKIQTLLNIIFKNNDSKKDNHEKK